MVAEARSRVNDGLSAAPAAGAQGAMPRAGPSRCATVGANQASPPSTRPAALKPPARKTSQPAPVMIVAAARTIAIWNAADDSSNK